VTTFVLARHGETDWNREGRWQGHADPPLNETGRRQARELADRLADMPLDAIYSSDLRRAFETAEIVAARKGMAPQPVASLREVDVGSWSGLTRAEIAERFPGMDTHDGETREEHGRRLRDELRRLLAAHPGGRVLLVTHGGSLRHILRAVGSPRADGDVVGNCEVTEVELHDLD
jgi:probable phosphoglycerate mutase